MPDAVMGPKVRELFEMDAENKRRLRDIEQRLKVIDNSVKKMDSTLLDVKTRAMEAASSVKDNKDAADNKVRELENSINDIVNGMKRFADKAEVAGLKELVDIYNPIKSQFITREEVERLIADRRGR